MKKILITSLMLAFCGMVLAETIVTEHAELRGPISNTNSPFCIAKEYENGRMIVSAIKATGDGQPTASLTYTSRSITTTTAKRLRARVRVMFMSTRMADNIGRMNDGDRIGTNIQINIRRPGGAASDIVESRGYNVDPGSYPGTAVGMAGQERLLLASTGTLLSDAVPAGTYFVEVRFVATTRREFSFACMNPVMGSVELESY